MIIRTDVRGVKTMEKKNLDWENLSFAYIRTDYRYVANYTAKAGQLG